MQIDYLIDHPDAVPLLARWHVAEWAALYPGWTEQAAEAELRGHTGRRQIPTTLVAVEDGRPLGSVSLLTADLEGHDDLSPWLASLYVVPERRGRGLGRQLVARAVEEARALAVPDLYLFTPGQEGLYRRLGWSRLRLVRHQGREVVVMRLRTGA
jgi:predicted N-acetyltransferase YhbS